MAGTDASVEDALRDREGRLLAILNTAADAIITIDEQGIIQSVNPATEQLFGYATDEMVGKNVSMLMPQPYRDEHDRYLQRYLETGRARIIGIGREVVARRKNGSVFPADLAVSRVDHLKLFTGIIRDITRRKDLEREVAEIATLQQWRIGEELHDSVAQELTALNLLVDDLAETLRTDPGKAPFLVERMSQGLRRSQKELRDALHGLLHVSVEAHGLTAALSELADRIRGDGKLDCSFDCSDLVAVANKLTATHLYLIAQEAIHNAVKHAHAKKVSITLRKTGGGLVLSVIDDGVGPPSSTAKHQGLGMRIMQNRAAILGARLTIGPVKPSGTKVTCTWLRTNDAKEEAHEESASPDR
jgi:PAS domain S-box-containing protein